MSNDAPTGDQPSVSRKWLNLRTLKSFALGSATGCLLVFFALDAVGFLSYTKLMAFVVVSGLVALLPQRRVLLRVTLANAVILSALIIFTPAMDLTVGWLDVSEAPHSADVIVVLGAGIHCGSGQLDGTSVARTTKGLSLWKAGFAPEMTVSDADASIVGAGCPSEGKATVDFIETILGQNGPPVRVLAHMRSTRTEARAIAKLQEEKNWNTVMVVTSPTHTRRALDTFRKAGVNAFVVAADEPNFDLKFNRPADRLRAFAPVLRELAGMIKYRLTA